jgi:hypothetical protein
MLAVSAQVDERMHLVNVVTIAATVCLVVVPVVLCRRCGSGTRGGGSVCGGFCCTSCLRL